LVRPTPVCLIPEITVAAVELGDELELLLLDPQAPTPTATNATAVAASADRLKLCIGTRILLRTEFQL
jgi:hypothetical protein